MHQLISSRKNGLGPFPINEIPHIQANIQRSFATVLTKYNDQMNLERRERQQGIDTLEEYESIGANCPERNRR
jgi:hypothetical protein